MAFLDIANVTKSFGPVEVLHDISIGVDEGEFLVLVGPSGCGKSTLLNIIAGLEQMTSGQISIKGRMVNGVHPSRRNIAMVFQSYALYPNMTVAQNITFGLEMHGVPKAEREEALQRIAGLLQTGHLLDRKPAQLSGGQRQRVAMGRALVRNPDVFLFDEPLSNLDAKLRVELRTEIKQLHQDLKTTMVYVTHDQIEAMTLASRIVVLEQGFIQQIGAPKEVYDTPANLFVAGFMGSPSMNLLPVTIERHGDGTRLVVGENGDDGIALEPGLRHPGLLRQAGRRLIMGIRPEGLTDQGSADRDSSKIETVRTKARIVEPTGSDTFVTLSVQGQDCVARVRADAEVRVGHEFDFALNMDRTVFFDPDSGQRVDHQSA